MTNGEREDSFYEARAVTRQGRLGLAAASAAAGVSRLLHAAKAASRLSSKEIAAELGVTEGRVSQVFSGDGNLHVATVARFVRAMGYELTIGAVPIEDKRPALDLRGRRSRRKAGEADKTFEVFLQTFLTHEGPVKVPMVVAADDVLRTTPHGGPTQVARVKVSRRGYARRLPTPQRSESWTTGAIELTGAVEVNRAAS
jgi:DNA-binding phage protein